MRIYIEGLNGFPGKQLGDFLQLEGWGTASLGDLELDSEEERLALFATGYVFAGDEIDDSETKAHLALLKSRVELCRSRGVRLIYIAAACFPERTAAAAALLALYPHTLCLAVPEIVDPAIRKGWLFGFIEAIRTMTVGESIIIDGENKSKDFLHIADLGYFVMKLAGTEKWPTYLELASYNRLTNRQLIQYIINVVKKDIHVLWGADGYDTVSLNTQEAQKAGFAARPVYDILKEILPPRYAEGQGSSLEFYEEERRQKEMAADLSNYISQAQVFRPTDREKAAYAYAGRILEKKYKKIKIAVIVYQYIAYFCYNLYLQRWELPAKAEELYLFIPHLMQPNQKQKCANWWLWEKCRNNHWPNSEFIDDSNIMFWQYVLAHTELPIELDVSYNQFHAMSREMDYRYRPMARNFILDFTPEEIQEGEAVAAQMGIAHRPYICFHSRDMAYNKVAKGGGFDEICTFHDRCRNTTIENYRPALAYLGEKGIFSLRMGAAVEQEFSGRTIIDYASHYRTEMLDFFFMSRCRFFIGTNSGIVFMAMLFGMPMVLINWGQLILANDVELPLRPDRDLFIPKKVWHKAEKRYLSLREILEFEMQHPDAALYVNYYEADCEIHESSPEEIYQVVREMEERLEGRRPYSAEEEALQERYREILMDAVVKSGFRYTDARCGTDFLRDNPWFLA